MRMRIAYLSSSQLPSCAANSVHVMKMCAAFIRNGHDVILFARDGGLHKADLFRFYGVEERFEIRFVPWRSGRADPLVYPWRVLRQLRREPSPPDLVYGRHSYSVLAATSMELPAVYEVHALSPPPDWRTLRRLTPRASDALLLRRPSLRRVVCISAALRDDFIATFGDGGSRAWDVVVAHDGADPPSPGVSARAAAPSSGGRLQAGYSGHLYRGRGLEVIEALARRLTHIDFHVVGGSDEDVEQLRNRARGADNLTVHGHVAPAEVAGLLAGFDVLLAPYQQNVAVAGDRGDTSRWMSPLKIFEYMAAGRPIVSSDLPVLREVLSDGVDAVLVPANDVDAWERAIAMLASDPVRRRSLGERAQANLVENYTWTARAEHVLKNLAVPVERRETAGDA